MRKLALLLIILLPACTTIGKWTDDSMAWADRTFPTYDDLFGDGESGEQQQVQRQAFPPEPVEAEQMNRQQEVYYDSSERGHSF